MIFKLPKNVEEIVYSQNRSSCECSACGRFVGALEVCPFCRHFNRKRLSVFLLKYLSPLAAIVGIALLFYLGNRYGHPQVKIKQLGTRSNFAQIEIAGTVCSDIRHYPSDIKAQGSGGSLEFNLDDGTGIIKVRCYDDAVAELVRSRKIPVSGDKVTIRGTYQFKAKNDFIILGSAQGITIDKNFAHCLIPIAKIANKNSGSSENEPVIVTGTVASVEFRKYDFILLLKDEGNSVLKVTLPISLLDLFGLSGGENWSDRPKIGDVVRVKGLLQWDRYSKRFAVMVGLPEHIEKVKDGTAK